MEFRLIKKLKDRGRWRIFKLKLIDARLTLSVSLSGY